MTQEELLHHAPTLSEQELEQINGVFQAFVFRRSKTGEVWTTCCRKYIRIRDYLQVPPELDNIMAATHTPEPKESWGCVKNPESRLRVTCPFCGREAKLKELGRTGKRYNLYSWERAVVLRQHEDALWAVAYDCNKSYAAPKGPLTGTQKLTKLPAVKKVGVMRFRPGEAENVTRGWWKDTWDAAERQTEPRTKAPPCLIGRPYANSRDYGFGYNVIGWPELDKSAFRYTQIPEICKKRSWDLLRLLTLCCLYGTKVEMLHKAGLDACIWDYIKKGKKNAWLLDWAATDRKHFCKEKLPILREALQEKEGLEGLRFWTEGKKKDRLEDCIWLAQELPDQGRLKRIRRRAKEFGLSMERIRNYLEANHKPKTSISGVEQHWHDYLDAAEKLGLPMENDVIRMPKDLYAAHDQRTKQWAAIVEARRKDLAAKDAKKRQDAYQARYQSLCRRYEMTVDGMSVLVPKNDQEIIDEGKTLHHCVGGYAPRHLTGSTTILFLRKAERPDVPLVTIEINGNNIIQAHGHSNEINPCPENPERIAPRILYKSFFTKWLNWLKKGSPRDKDGAPKIGKKSADKQCLSIQDERKVSA